MKKKVVISSRFEKILEDIKTVKVQGAENVAKAGIKAFLLKPTKKSMKRILRVRSTEPLLQNALRIIYCSKDKQGVAEQFLWNLEQAHERIAWRADKLVKDNMNVYSHCHSSTVMDILKQAKKNGKKFVVYTSEVEPLLQGRKTARELSRAGIKVIVSPDLAIEQMISKCDLFLFGADAFTKKVVVNKIGTSLLVSLAKKYKVPRYSCGVSKKFTRKVAIEKRSSKEVWDTRAKNVEVDNPAFDATLLSDLTGVVSEFGVLDSKMFVKRARKGTKKA